MGTYFIRLLIIIGTIIVARFFQSRSLKALNEEQREQLTKVNASVRIYHWAGLLFLVLLFYFNLEDNWIDYSTSIIYYGMALISYVLLTTIHIHNKLKEKNFPKSYMKLSLLAATTRALGVMVFFCIT